MENRNANLPLQHFGEKRLGQLDARRDGTPTLAGREFEKLDGAARLVTRGQPALDQRDRLRQQLRRNGDTIVRLDVGLAQRQDLNGLLGRGRIQTDLGKSLGQDVARFDVLPVLARRRATDASDPTSRNLLPQFLKSVGRTTREQNGYVVDEENETRIRGQNGGETADALIELACPIGARTEKVGLQGKHTAIPQGHGDRRVPSDHAPGELMHDRSLARARGPHHDGAAVLALPERLDELDQHGLCWRERRVKRSRLLQKPAVALQQGARSRVERLGWEQGPRLL